MLSGNLVLIYDFLLPLAFLKLFSLEEGGGIVDLSVVFQSIAPNLHLVFCFPRNLLLT